MSMTLAEACDVINGRIAQAEAVLALRDVLEAAGAAESRAAVLAEQAAASQNVLDEKTAKVAEAVAQANDIREAANAAIQQARVDADSFLQKAKTDAQAMIDAAKAQVDAADEMLKAKGVELAALSRDLETKTAALAEVEAQFEAVREAVRKMQQV